jgi:predicted amidohydrolase
MDDTLTLAVDNFHPFWGNKQANLQRIITDMHTAAKAGAQLLVLPELCLTGYDDPENTPFAQKLQVQQAEPVPGPSSQAVAQAAADLNLWVVFGMPEREAVKGARENASVDAGTKANCSIVHATDNASAAAARGGSVDAKAGAEVASVAGITAAGTAGDASAPLRANAGAATAAGTATAAGSAGGTNAAATTGVSATQRPRIYNAACIVSPQGVVGTYRKIHPFGRENEWATAGDTPCVVDTPWGPIGVGICYDLYSFPEMVMYAKAKGARLFLNPTAAGWAISAADVFRAKIEVTCLRGNLYVATANLQGTDRTSTFVGQSHIIGPLGPRNSVRYFAGPPFAEGPEPQPGLRIATIDLSAVENQASWNLHVFGTNPLTGRPDWRPDLYAKWFAEVANDPQWRARTKRR